MIRLECDNCEKPFEVDDKEAGGRVPCPACGDINRVPASSAGEASAAGGAAAAAATPQREGREEAIRVVRPAMFRAHPIRGLLVTILLVGGAILTPSARFAEAVPAWLFWPGLVAILVGMVWWALWWVQTTLWIRVEISNKRTVRYEGIVRRSSTEVLHDHVRSVDINQNFIQRLFNVGYIGIDSAGQDGIEIEIRDIPGPYQIKEIIDRYRTM